MTEYAKLSEKFSWMKILIHYDLMSDTKNAISQSCKKLNAEVQFFYE